MADLPLVYLAFANDAAAPLRLGREKDDICRALRDAEERKQFDVFDTAETTLEKLADDIRRYGDRIALFHYGGHAGADGPRLQNDGNGRTAYAAGLAAMLAPTGVRLVFLNGCGTKPQVDAFHRSGIKAVLATSVPIEDAMATDFAGQFYLSLGNGSTIRAAFEFANAYIAAQYKPEHQLEISTRGLEPSEPVDSTDPGRTWGLYIAAGGEAVLDWTLCTPVATDSVGGAIDASASTNAKLRDRLAAAIEALGDPALARTLKVAAADADDPEAALVHAIIAAFPLPIGEQLRILFIRAKPDLDRLEQLIRTYEVTMQLFGYAALAQLWDARASDTANSLRIADEHRAVLSSFLALSETDAAAFDYYQLTVAVLEILRENAVEPFLRQCSEVLAALGDQPSKAAHTSLEAIRRQPPGQLPPDQIAATCGLATDCMTEILCDLAFICLYKATTIRSIAVDHYRNRKARFVHATAALDGGQLSDVIEGRSYDSSTDSQSVILQRDRELGSDFLNLTPLVIDESAFSNGRLPNLYFFSHQDPASEGYVYRMIGNPANTIVVPDADQRHACLKPIKRMFDEFKTVVFAA